MPVVRPPARRSTLRQWAIPALVAASVAAFSVFLCHRFGDSPAERAEKLLAARDFAALKSHVGKQIAAGGANPLFHAYLAVAEFSLNNDADLAALMAKIQAADERVIFRREALLRIAEIPQNAARAGIILEAALALENPPGSEMHKLTERLVQAELPLVASPRLFTALAGLFPEKLRQVKAKELQFRKAPSTGGEVIRRLSDREELLVRTSGARTTVSGKQGSWVFVLDRHMQSGWVFDGYLVQPAE